jgi:hypothetical protein
LARAIVPGLSQLTRLDRGGPIGRGCRARQRLAPQLDGLPITLDGNRYGISYLQALDVFTGGLRAADWFSPKLKKNVSGPHANRRCRSPGGDAADLGPLRILLYCEPKPDLWLRRCCRRLRLLCDCTRHRWQGRRHAE